MALDRAARAEPGGRQQRRVHRDLPADVHREHVRAARARCPAPLQTFADWNPVSAVTQAARELFGNIPADQLPAADALVAAAPGGLHADLGGRLLVVFVPLAIRQYRRSPAADRRRREAGAGTHEAGSPRGGGAARAGAAQPAYGSASRIFDVQISLPFGRRVGRGLADLLADDRGAERGLLAVDLEVGVARRPRGCRAGTSSRRRAGRP